jgi:hypothetical protein
MNDMAHPPIGEGVLDRLQGLVGLLKHWRPQIEEALHHGKDAHTFDTVVEMILSNRLHFFAYPDCFVIMEIVEYPNYKVFHCFLAGGKMEAIIQAQQPLGEVGKIMGCRYLSVSGRKGWERQLADIGWKFVCTTLYYEIGEPK